MGTGDAVPLKQPSYQIPVKMQKMEELKYRLEIGVVEPGQRDWRLPIVLVRFCIDYRQVNRVTNTGALHCAVCLCVIAPVWFS